MGQPKPEVLCLIVENNYGVLTRISSLFGRKGYNIDTLNVSTTDSPRISRITLTVTGEEHEINQIISQCEKLEEVCSVQILRPEDSVLREILLVKLAVVTGRLPRIMEMANIFKATAVSLTRDTIILELTGKPQKIDAFLDLAKEFEIIEMARTGATAMLRVN